MDVYKQKIYDEYGVNLEGAKFRGNKKWSDRVRDTFLTHGKPWNNGVEASVKATVADCVKRDAANALHEQKRISIDALVSSLEEMLS